MVCVEWWLLLNFGFLTAVGFGVGLPVDCCFESRFGVVGFAFALLVFALIGLFGVWLLWQGWCRGFWFGFWFVVFFWCFDLLGLICTV